MRQIICGAGGFLGSALRKYFEDKGDKVTILPVEMLYDINGMHELLRDGDPYYIYYLAAYGNLHGQSDIREQYQVAVIKLLNLLEATKDTLCESFVTAGTTSEYGNKTVNMTEDLILNPETHYGAAKAAGTHLAQVWAKRQGLPIIVFRPASITGVGEQSIHLIPTLISSCLFNQVIPFIGEPMHDYINVFDVCSALDILSQNAWKYKGQIFNVGTSKQTSNLEVKDMIEHITGEKVKISTSAKINPDNISQVWIADSSKLRTLGWKPKVTLMESLKQMVRAV